MGKIGSSLKLAKLPTTSKIEFLSPEPGINFLRAFMEILDAGENPNALRAILEGSIRGIDCCGFGSRVRPVLKSPKLRQVTHIPPTK
jgi:hypothetical protein